MKKEYLGILKKGLSKIQVVQLFNEKHQPKPVIRILDRNYHAGRTAMKLYCDNCGHMFKHEEQAYVKEHIYIKLGADVTSQYVDTTGKNIAEIKSYIANQLKVDKKTDQLSIFDPRDPFTGSK